MIEHDAERTGQTLTRREREVVELLAGGLSGVEIARELSLSPETIRTHLRNAMVRTGAKTRPHLTALAAGGEAERGQAGPS